MKDKYLSLSDAWLGGASHFVSATTGANSMMRSSRVEFSSLAGVGEADEPSGHHDHEPPPAGPSGALEHASKAGLLLWLHTRATQGQRIQVTVPFGVVSCSSSPLRGWCRRRGGGRKNLGFRQPVFCSGSFRPLLCLLSGQDGRRITLHTEATTVQRST